MNLLVLVVLGQFYVPTLPAYDPAGYHRAYPEYIFPAGPPVGNPRVISLRPIGEIIAVDTKASIFTVQYPGYQSRYHYGKGTRLGGPLEVGRWVHVDVSNHSVDF